MGSSKVSLVGKIDEDFMFPEVEGSLDETLYIDFLGIKAINSVGIKSWLEWSEKLASRKTVVLKNVPVCVVMQMNMITHFLPENFWVESFEVPLVCERCESEKIDMVELGKEVKIQDGKVIVDLEQEFLGQFGDPDCDCFFEVDTSGDRYFRFLKA
ncbi:MAG: hypothetical protein HRT44_11190 [Bdellovibrionales bacterium]|nr:hypothetical protein [Bdellovibrionales bacterium]NQZ19805.1 hypothetical protein [Bdellovibrionales bacterium]